MVKRKSTCGLCKPHKKWKKNDTRALRKLEKQIYEEILDIKPPKVYTPYV